MRTRGIIFSVQGDNFLYNAFKGPGDIRENENSINVEDDVLNVRCKDFQQNYAKGNESLDRDA